jgi:hypothetical protein
MEDFPVLAAKVAEPLRDYADEEADVAESEGLAAEIVNEEHVQLEEPASFGGLKIQNSLKVGGSSHNYNSQRSIMSKGAILSQQANKIEEEQSVDSE